MERGLLWLPLLALFFWLTWAGWNEYQKLEAYKGWAEGFDRAKYDIYAVLGQKGNDLTWGKPTRKGPVNLETFSLETVQSIRLLVNDQAVEMESSPTKGRSALEFLRGGQEPVRVPFTDPTLAAKWGQFLQTFMQQRQTSQQDDAR
ncbi:hypothetical protein H6F43_18225 [Leptolyngbya sp. FACHB-36]|uniref:hypothetical protein n=1 Tax=Leptolyngbya sp. FACHB-36 TaxID=2692808 RepID=UPI001681A6AA|nr:hypothetical protein [Leptolyngbya sp. FACHB-36]MBD2022119.1 hypothetical protein [Leptolyngbya sp. FACHB-36]